MQENKLKQYNKTRNFSQRKLVCYAPKTTMRFSLSGNVLACCYNRKYFLGKFPENNLHDIWFGKKIEKLQRSIAGNDFYNGCHRCEEDIISGNYSRVGAKQYDYLSKYKAENAYPVMLDFEISNTCNLECIMCNGENSSLIRKNVENLPPISNPYNDIFIEQIIEFIPHLKEARFVGGESFLMDINYKIWKKIVEINPKVEISVLTNGTLLNEKINKIINQGNFRISLSIDSFNKQTYESIRKNADFETVTNNLEYFKQHSIKNNYTFNINVCPIRQNWEEIPEIVEYCNQNNFNLIFHTVVFPPNTSLWNLSKEELGQIIKFYKKQNIFNKGKLSKANIATFNGLILQIENWQKIALSQEEERNFYDLKTEELESILFENISDFPNNRKYIDVIRKSFYDINDDEIMKKALITLNKMSIKDIIAEIEISTQDKITERFKAAARI